MSKHLRAAWLLAGAGLALPVHAVEVSPEGLGQALIYPYYTTRASSSGAWNTYLSVVNTTQDAKALRVRFREGRNGREVLGFNLYLGANDTWVAAVVPDSASALAPARVIAPDNSCTSPPVTLPGGAVLSAAAFSGALDDGYGSAADRTREGYVEVIEMATLTGTIREAVTAAATGVPANCTLVRDGTYTPPPSDVHAPTGGLSGTDTLINVNDGMDMGFNAVALSNLASAPFFRPPSDPYPDFDAAEVDRWANVHGRGIPYHLTFSSGKDAVTAALMRDTVKNEFVLDPQTGSASAWVVTLPTRRFHAAGSPPFSSKSGCEPTPITVYDREGRVASSCTTSGCAAAVQLCYAATIIDWAQSSLFASTNQYAVTQGLPANGWASLAVPDESGHKLPSMPDSTGWVPFNDQVATQTWYAFGLPVVGFAARSFRNGTLRCDAAACQGNYGGVFMHRYRSSVTLQ